MDTQIQTQIINNSINTTATTTTTTPQQTSNIIMNNNDEEQPPIYYQSNNSQQHAQQQQQPPYYQEQEYRLIQDDPAARSSPQNDTYSQGAPPPHSSNASTTSSTNNSASCNNNSPFYWRFTDFDHIPDVSRDGSIYATDEVFNSASHLSATLLSILGSALLISASSAQGNAWKIVSFSIYGASLIFLFLASTLHHSLVGSIEPFLRTMDYVAIYPLIAGTFTPLCLVYFHHSVIGWTFFGVIWLVCLWGMIMTATCFSKIPKWLSMTMYITLGWMGACMTYWLLPKIGTDGFLLLMLGGVLYTAGGYIFTTEPPQCNLIPGRFGFHEIWHIAVVLAALSHWCLMYFYVLQWQEE